MIINGENSGSPPTQYGGFWRRAVAMLIDVVLVQVAAVIASMPVSIALAIALAGAVAEQDVAALAGLLGFVIGSVMQWLYFAIMESSAKQATYGKKLLGLLVTDAEGARLSFGRATGRYFAKFLSLLSLIGFYLAGFTSRKQALHDFVAKTLVVRKVGS